MSEETEVRTFSVVVKGQVGEIDDKIEIVKKKLETQGLVLKNVEGVFEGDEPVGVRLLFSANKDAYNKIASEGNQRRGLQKLQEVVQANIALQKQVAALQELKTGENDELTLLQEAFDALTQERDELEKERDVLKAQLASSSAETANLVATTTGDDASAKEELSRLQAELAVSNSKLQNGAEDARKFQADLASVSQEKEQLQRSLDEFHDEKMMLEQHISTLQKEAEFLREQHARASAAALTEADAAQLRADMAELECQKEGFQTRVDALAADRAGFVQEQQKLEVMKQELAAEIQVMKTKQSVLDEEVVKNQQEAEKYRAELKRICTVRDGFFSVLNQMRTQLSTYKSEIQDYKQATCAEMAIIAGVMNILVQRIREEHPGEAAMAPLSDYEQQRRQLQALSVPALQDSLTVMTENYRTAQDRAKRIHNQIQELRGSIRVYCRVRPLSKAEDQHGTCVSCSDGMKIQLYKHDARTKEQTVKDFDFDRVFMHDASQITCFEETEPLVASAVDGFNVCIFAYGQTGSGKTHTLLGDFDSSCADGGVQQGLTYRALTTLLDLRDQKKDSLDIQIRMSMFEIYNENLQDVLAPPPEPGQKEAKLTVIGDPGGDVKVAGLSEHPVATLLEGVDLLLRGAASRATGATKMNDHSSRSHLLVLFRILTHDTVSRTRCTSKLYMIDLAGSEDVSKSGATAGAQLREAANINKSLSALHNVMGALVKQSSHIPFRNSKLTHVLSDALGGKAKTLMYMKQSGPFRPMQKVILGAAVRAERQKDGGKESRVQTMDEEIIQARVESEIEDRMQEMRQSQGLLPEYTRFEREARKSIAAGMQTPRSSEELRDRLQLVLRALAQGSPSGMSSSDTVGSSDWKIEHFMRFSGSVASVTRGSFVRVVAHSLELQEEVEPVLCSGDTGAAELEQCLNFLVETLRSGGGPLRLPGPGDVRPTSSIGAESMESALLKDPLARFGRQVASLTLCRAPDKLRPVAAVKRTTPAPLGTFAAPAMALAPQKLGPPGGQMGLAPQAPSDLLRASLVPAGTGDLPQLKAKLPTQAPLGSPGAAIAQRMRLPPSRSPGMF